LSEPKSAFLSFFRSSLILAREANSVEEVREHMLSACVKVLQFVKMRQAAEDAVPKKREADAQSYRNTRQGRSYVIKGTNQYIDDTEGKQAVEGEEPVAQDASTVFKNLIQMASRVLSMFTLFLTRL
jgi:hypothetical protein